MPDEPIIEFVFNRGRTNEFALPVRQEDLEEVFAQHVRDSKVALFGRSFDAQDSDGIAEAAHHYAKATVAAVVSWGAAVDETHGERSD